MTNGSDFNPPETTDVYRFPVADPPDRSAMNPDHLIGLLFKALLDLVIPVHGDQDVFVDGYKLLSDRTMIHPLFSSREDIPEPATDSLELYEPRIGFIQGLLQSLLGLIDLESGGRAVNVDGFSLKDPSRWLTPSNGASDILAHAATRCNLDCLFCYNKTSSPVSAPKAGNAAKEFQQIRSRIHHYVPGSKLSIFPDMKSPGESLSHPHIKDILRKLRSRTGECFRISTHGSTLTPEMIGVLSDCRPVYLDISINSASPERRRILMGDHHPEIALSSLRHLEKAEIPYSVVIVPWPYPSADAMFRDLSETLDFAAAHSPTLIQISLPGWAGNRISRDIQPDESLWTGLTGHIRSFRDRADCPVVVRPGLFEDYLNPERINEPVLAGVINNSPLARAGLRKGDRMVKINGIPVRTRRKARTLLTVLHQSDLTATSITVQRAGEPISIPVPLRCFAYPYSPEAATHLGAVFSHSGIPEQWPDLLRQTISSRKAKRVLVLTSKLIRPFMEKAIRADGGFSAVDLYLLTPENRYFGGNICMGDLLVVEDFIVAVEDFIKKSRVRPDLVILPSSPFHISGWGRDLTGRVYLDIERRLGIPAALVECDPLLD